MSELFTQTLNWFLVGGAVRDQFLGIPAKERDYVVVGATSQQMLDLGFEQVGKDFPVFLHPKTKAEYALARTERKTAPGYHGFECLSTPHITLEEDLQRRDLTVNAMALTPQGQLIDPYQGLKDLQDKTLRHVSPAFVEDPLRVLRVARFAAQFHALGFHIAPETLTLMQQIVAQGELDFLAKERIWIETTKAFQTANPAVYFDTLNACGALSHILGQPLPKQASFPLLQQVAKQTESAQFAALTLDLKTYLVNFEQINTQLNHWFTPPKRVCQFTHLVQATAILYEDVQPDAETLLDFYHTCQAWRNPDLINTLAAFWQHIKDTPTLSLPIWALHIFKPVTALLEINAAPFITKGLKGKQIGEAIYQARLNKLKELWCPNDI